MCNNKLFTYNKAVFLDAEDMLMDLTVLQRDLFVFVWVLLQSCHLGRVINSSLLTVAFDGCLLSMNPTRLCQCYVLPLQESRKMMLLK